MPVDPLRSPAGERLDPLWVSLRVLLAGLIAAHGWARALAGGVAPFGSFLEAQGLPAGAWLAMGITGLEIIGPVSLLIGRAVAPLCALYSLIYMAGIVLVHAPAGWFVVGLGRNGSEYSVLLIACLLMVGWRHHRPWRGD
ncbi:MAG TPA: DoxX family protein [Nevskiaceae bacterium]|nr:DoxX family protein [Nevskiaceae bacterium]